MGSERRDIASNADAYDYLIKCPLFSRLHDRLFKSVSSHLENIEGPSLAVLGPSASFSPYSKNPGWLSRKFSKGRLVLVDYNGDLLDAASRSIEPLCRLSAIEHDLRDGLPLEKGSIDFIDATLTLHHVAPYRHQLDGMIRGIFESLKKSGALFWGEGFVDMRFSEQRIKEIAADLHRAEKRPVSILDKRDPNFQYIVSYDGQGLCVSKAGALHEHEDALIDKEGNIDYAKSIAKRKESLIDPSNEAHYRRHYKPVGDFYKAHVPFLRGLSGLGASPEAVSRVIAEQKKEMLNAQKGLVEYYSSKETMIDSLKKAGFTDIEVIVTSEGLVPDYAQIGAIIARKP
jgi:hypothetical protein